MFFYTDLAGLGVATAGFVLGAGRVWDAVNDPAVGYLSDRTRSRFGRRRPWFAIAALPLGLSVFALFAPPRALRRTSSSRSGCWSRISPPTRSSRSSSRRTTRSARSSREDPDERTRIVAIRTGLLVRRRDRRQHHAVPGALAANAEDLRAGYGERRARRSARSRRSRSARRSSARASRPRRRDRAASLGDFARGVRESLAQPPVPHPARHVRDHEHRQRPERRRRDLRDRLLARLHGRRGGPDRAGLPRRGGALAPALGARRAALRQGPRAARGVHVRGGDPVVDLVPHARTASGVRVPHARRCRAGGLHRRGVAARRRARPRRARDRRARGGAFFGFWTFALKLAAGAGPPIVGAVLGALGYVAERRAVAAGDPGACGCSTGRSRRCSSSPPRSCSGASRSRARSTRRSSARCSERTRRSVSRGLSAARLGARLVARRAHGGDHVAQVVGAARLEHELDLGLGRRRARERALVQHLRRRSRRSRRSPRR